MAISTAPAINEQDTQSLSCNNSYVQQVGTEVSQATKNALKDFGAILPCDERTLEKRPTDTEELTPIQIAEKMVQADKIQFSKQSQTQLAALDIDIIKDAYDANERYNKANERYNKANEKVKKVKKDLKNIKDAWEKGGKMIDDLI